MLSRPRSIRTLVLGATCAAALMGACEPEKEEGGGGRDGNGKGGTGAQAGTGGTQPGTGGTGGAASNGGSGGGGRRRQPARGDGAQGAHPGQRGGHHRGRQIRGGGEPQRRAADGVQAGPGRMWPATKTYDLDVGKKAEPWMTVVGNDDDTAYVILRKDQQVLRIRNLRTAPKVDEVYAKTGSEPTGLAISPTGARLFVANWAEGTVTVVNTDTMGVVKTVDLNAALAASGMLGPDVQARPALAHPRALVVTNDGDGDDSDETVYVTEFFSQARTDAVPEDDSRFDVGRQGVVYYFNAGSGEVGAPITLASDAGHRLRGQQGQDHGLLPQPAVRRGSEQRPPVRHRRLLVAARSHRSRRRAGGAR